jgi:Na+-driven multidrug efflux pump
MKESSIKESRWTGIVLGIVIGFIVTMFASKIFETNPDAVISTLKVINDSMYYIRIVVSFMLFVSIPILIIQFVRCGDRNMVIKYKKTILTVGSVSFVLFMLTYLIEYLYTLT